MGYKDPVAAHAWYMANRELVLERQQKYRKANRDKLRARRCQHRAENVERFREIAREYYRANRERINARRRQKYAEKRALSEKAP